MCFGLMTNIALSQVSIRANVSSGRSYLSDRFGGHDYIQTTRSVSEYWENAWEIGLDATLGSGKHHLHTGLSFTHLKARQIEILTSTNVQQNVVIESVLNFSLPYLRSCLGYMFYSQKFQMAVGGGLSFPMNHQLQVHSKRNLNGDIKEYSNLNRLENINVIFGPYLLINVPITEMWKLRAEYHFSLTDYHSLQYFQGGKLQYAMIGACYQLY